jgi:hypothetical protein
MSHLLCRLADLKNSISYKFVDGLPFKIKFQRKEEMQVAKKKIASVPFGGFKQPIFFIICVISQLSKWQEQTTHLYAKTSHT